MGSWFRRRGPGRGRPGEGASRVVEGRVWTPEGFVRGQQEWSEWPPAPRRGRGPATRGLENGRRGFHDCQGVPCPGRGWTYTATCPRLPQFPGQESVPACVCVCFVGEKKFLILQNAHSLFHLNFFFEFLHF